MDTIDLPIADLSTPLEDAFATMKAAGRSAVVARAPGPSNELYLFKAHDVVQQLASGGGVLDAVAKRWKLPVLTDPVRVRAVVRAAGRPQEKHFPLIFGATGSPYLVATVGPASIQLVTRSEVIALPLRAVPSDCYCSGPLHHDCVRPEGVKCPHIGCPGTVTCI